MWHVYLFILPIVCDELRVQFSINKTVTMSIKANGERIWYLREVKVGTVVTTVLVSVNIKH